MAVLFFDSNGLIKHDIQEVGTAWIQSLSDPTAGHERYIAAITGVEMVSAVQRRRNRGETSPTDAALAISNIEADFTVDHSVLEVSLARIREAMPLAKTHGLRGYDAVQLATALYLRGQCRLEGASDPILVTADRDLIRAARAEGMTVEGPNTHP